MEISKLAEKYINRCITWLSKWDTYKGMTGIEAIEEKLTSEQLDSLCKEINKDERVKASFIDGDYTLTIIFKR